jgi:hypothetical protein
MWESEGPCRLSLDEGTTLIIWWGSDWAPEMVWTLWRSLANPRESNLDSSIVRFSQIRLEFADHLPESTGPLLCSFLIIGVRCPAVCPQFGFTFLPGYIWHSVFVPSASIELETEGFILIYSRQSPVFANSHYTYIIFKMTEHGRSGSLFLTQFLSSTVVLLLSK